MEGEFLGEVKGLKLNHEVHEGHEEKLRVFIEYLSCLATLAQETRGSFWGGRDGRVRKEYE